MIEQVLQYTLAKVVVSLPCLLYLPNWAYGTLLAVFPNIPSVEPKY